MRARPIGFIVIGRLRAMQQTIEIQYMCGPQLRRSTPERRRKSRRQLCFSPDSAGQKIAEVGAAIAYPGSMAWR
jgi:hypothetical protein